MKKKIFIGLILLSICFVLGGSYITATIEAAIDKLENIITLHQVEIFRKNLLSQIKLVQSDLLLKDSPHSRGVEMLVEHVEKMDDSVKICFECHHEPDVEEQLEGLQLRIGAYEKSISRVYTIRANRVRLDSEKQKAFEVGQQLIDEVNAIVVSSSEKLFKRTQMVLIDIAESKKLLTVIVISGPFIALLLAFFYVRRLTFSVSTLITATRKIKEGDLAYRVTDKLYDEFQEFAISFNEMAISLKDQCKRVEESQKRYRVLFETAGDAIFIMEAEGENIGKIVSANQAAADMHGYTIEELLEMKIQDIDTPEVAAEIPSRIKRILDGEWINSEINHRKKDGTIFPVEISAGLLEYENKKYILAFDRDITERKMAEEALQRAQQLVITGEMAAGLAHEIKNPLAGIKVSIEVLSNELALASEDKEVFLRIINEINRIETLLKNLLNYARPPRPQLAEIDINKSLEVAVKNAQFALKKPDVEFQRIKDIQIVKEFSDELPQVMADSNQIQQIFLNLLLNAIDAIPGAGSVTARTSVSNEGKIVIEISDTGKGLEQKDLEKIFQPFFTTKPKGTGLGLAICKRLIEQHGGTISATSNKDGGLTFTIVLPTKQENES